MSSQDLTILKKTEYGILTDKGFISTEPWGKKFVRKFKENPFVPIGATATVAALVMAVVKSQQGDSQKVNYWMRARVGFQFSTIVAIAVGAYLVGDTKQQREARAQTDNEAVLAQAAVERAEFAQRLKAAEEAQKVEDEMSVRGRKWIGMFGSDKDVTGGVQARNSAELQKLPLPTGVTSAPAGEANFVHAPDTENAVSSAPANADRVRTLVADAPEKSNWWSWFGGSSRKS